MTRREVLERLRAQVKAGKPLLMFGAGIGLTAKCAEKGGADLIGVYSTAIFRMRGQPSILAWLPYGDANSHMLRMAGEILPAVKRTPCIAGIGAHDPALNFDLLFDRILELGFSGVAEVVMSQSSGSLPRRLSRTQPPTAQASKPAALSVPMISFTFSGMDICVCLTPFISISPLKSIFVYIS